MCFKENKKERISENITNNKFDENISTKVVFGDAYKINNNTIIPVCDVFYINLNNFGKYNKINLSFPNNNIVSIKPQGFLVEKDNNIQFLPSSNNNIYVNLMEKFLSFTKNFGK